MMNSLSVIRSLKSIRSFLLYANQNWVSPVPSYLTLLGDANYDYKDLWTPVPSVRKQNLVPSYGYPVSDSWYSMWDSNRWISRKCLQAESRQQR